MPKQLEDRQPRTHVDLRLTMTSCPAPSGPEIAVERAALPVTCPIDEDIHRAVDNAPDSSGVGGAGQSPEESAAASGPDLHRGGQMGPINHDKSPRRSFRATGICQARSPG